MREDLLSINISPLRSFSQKNIQKSRHQKKRDREIQKLSEKLNNQEMRSLSITAQNKRVEYFPEENLIIKGFGPIKVF
jgi:hypothetical protein